MYRMLAPWFLSVANAVKKAIDYKPLIVFREKLSSIKTTVIMGTKHWASTNHLTSIIHLLLMPASINPVFT